MYTGFEESNAFRKFFRLDTKLTIEEFKMFHNQLEKNENLSFK
ncbi:hypothetical protein LEP1GSC203_2210 [Leptospira terpstrae serovar Hualin str. LT 11-33 = ATCC 700639]|uniref:Uncharacterized protein n=1 Tax=Leptospira terpstrae serovar Hualin str. LT 11-33 = ATCC 700639 TaxID=1257025 RepID=N1VR97_9LEPT|nr:hypothetical protein LEP1GSC203_2210 [Leptospira terpstrae serovar Hualin str. LT 11-33 = ATCC 700639]